MEQYNLPDYNTIKEMFARDGLKLTPVGEQYFKKNPEQMERLYNRWLRTHPTSLSESFPEFIESNSKNLYPHIVPSDSTISGLTRFEKPAGALGKPANSIMKGGMRGAAHLIPIVGAGLTAADIYQGLNQPVAAGTLDWNQMTPKQQAARVQGYQQVQDIIDNIQARQRVEDQYRQKQADMIRRARFGI